MDAPIKTQVLEAVGCKGPGGDGLANEGLRGRAEANAWCTIGTNETRSKRVRMIAKHGHERVPPTCPTGYAER